MELFKNINNLYSKLTHIGINASDDDEIILQKILMVRFVIPFIITGILWGCMYMHYNEPMAGSIPFIYSVITFSTLIYFKYSHNFKLFRFQQLLFILIFPCALMIALGGFINGSMVIIWGLISPLGAMLFDKPKYAPRWFIAYLLLVVLSGIFQSRLSHANNLSADQINMFFIINVGTVACLIFLMFLYFVKKKLFFQEQSESLLLNILPKEIANKLKKDTKTIAHHFDHVSVLFADIANFTPLSKGLPPSELVDLLNTIFSEFDSLVEKFGVEKIKTIGDCYMVASGVPIPRSDHASALVHMAVEMRELITNHSFLGKNIQFRIGIHSGPVVAGVIGHKKFAYDLWGETVNIASRMESHGISNKIQITQDTYELIKNEFDCTFYTNLQVKGGGEWKVWTVNGPIPANHTED